MSVVASPALRSLVELASNLVRATQRLASGSWDHALVQHTRQAFERLADHAANLDLEQIRMAALDLYIYLASLDSELAPDSAQSSEIGRLSAALSTALRPYRSAAQAVRADAPAAPSADISGPFVVVLSSATVPPGWAQRWLDRGIGVLEVEQLDELGEHIKAHLPIAILATSDQIVDLNTTLDELARHLPASANMIVVGVGSGAAVAEDRLRALLGGCELYVSSLDEPTLVSRVLELTQLPDPPYRVLLVDDDASTRMYVRAVLQQAGIIVEAVADPNSVEAQIQQFNPDLLLVDLFMPDVDGMTLTMRLRARADLAILPIVFLSGEQGDRARLQAIHAGGDDYLTKPVRPRSLVATVRDRIQRVRSLRRQLAPAVSEPKSRRGRARRGEFLAKLAEAAKPGDRPLHVLLALKLDQAELLREKLGLAGAYELEQSIDLRLIDVLAPDDSFTLWQEFGFGLLVERATPEALLEVAGRLCRVVAERAFKVLGQDMHLTASVGMSLAPTGDANGHADRWIASAFAAQAVANRLGGNRVDGVLDLETSHLPAERILMIREAVNQASKSLSIQVEFQPMLRLHGMHKDQYAVITKLRDSRAPLAGVSRDEYVETARKSGVLATIDRVALVRAFEAIAEQTSHGRATHIAVPMDLASFDRVQLLWLETELRRRGTPASSLALEFDVNVLMDKPNLIPVLQRLRGFDLGIVLADRSGNLTRVGKYQMLPVTMLRLPFGSIAALDPINFAAIFSAWRESGRSIVIDAVDDVAAVMRLWSFGIDYLQGDALAAPSPRLDFEAAEIEL